MVNVYSAIFEIIVNINYYVTHTYNVYITLTLNKNYCDINSYIKYTLVRE